MKTLIIDNNTKHLANLQEALAGHDIEIRKYHPGLDFNLSDKDLVVLSGGGGEGLEIHDEHKPGHLWYENEMSFIKNCQKPIIGICMGFEVIARAFGSQVEKLPEEIEGFKEFSAKCSGQKLFGKSHIKQFEAHSWGVKEVSEDFEVLAQSDTGIEFIKHKTRPIIATQFHPEKGGTVNLTELLQLQFT